LAWRQNGCGAGRRYRAHAYRGIDNVRTRGHAARRASVRTGENPFAPRIARRSSCDISHGVVAVLLAHQAATSVNNRMSQAICA